MLPPLRQKASHNDLSEEHHEEMLSGSDRDEYSSDASRSNPSEPDTEDEIADAKLAKSRKTLKRKRRATDAVKFGVTLQSLLSTDAPAAPLSLKPSVAKERKEKKLETKGKHVLQIGKNDKEDKGRITDMIGGWGGESERALRKVAQRGGTHYRITPGSNALVYVIYVVVKLFNAIQQSQTASAAAAQELKSRRGTGKPTLPAPPIHDKEGKGKHRDNIVGRGREGRPFIVYLRTFVIETLCAATTAQDDFLDIIRSGGVVSNA